MADFSKMKKAEVEALAKDLEARVLELEAALQSDDNKAVPGLINVGSLWGTDPQGNKYKNKNGEVMYIGSLNGRLMLTKNRFKQPGTRQPKLRLALMPFRPQAPADDGDLFDDVEGAQVDGGTQVADAPPPF